MLKDVPKQLSICSLNNIGASLWKYKVFYVHVRGNKPALLSLHAVLRAIKLDICTGLTNCIMTVSLFVHQVSALHVYVLIASIIILIPRQP